MRRLKFDFHAVGDVGFGVLAINAASFDGVGAGTSATGGTACGGGDQCDWPGARLVTPGLRYCSRTRSTTASAADVARVEIAGGMSCAAAHRGRRSHTARTHAGVNVAVS